MATETARESNDDTIAVCMLALNVYPAIDPSSGKRIGGLEGTAWNLARGLASEPGFDVSMIVRNDRSIPSTVDGVRLLAIIDAFRDMRHRVSKRVTRQNRFPWLKATGLSWRLCYELVCLTVTRWFRDRRGTAERIVEQMNRSQAEVLICFGNGEDPATMIRYGEATDKPTIAILQSNSDVDQRYINETDFVNEYGESAEDCRLVLEHSNLLIAQTQWQRDEISRIFGRSSELLQTPIDADLWLSGNRPFEERADVLWIGRYDQFHKRPGLAVEIARQCPKLNFVMVINDGDPTVKEELNRHPPPNVRIVDYVPKNEMPSRMQIAKAFLSTGSADFEGLPNVFLEAAASGTPIVTLHDFGDFVHNSCAGIAADGDIERATAELQRVAMKRDIWQSLSSNGRAWVQEHHKIDPVIRRLTHLIHDAIGRSRQIPRCRSESLDTEKF